METKNVYQMVTDRIIEQMQQGLIPWQKPWVGTGACAINYVSRKPYSPLNQMMLGRPGEYLSFKQVKDLGGSVKKGAKSNVVVFYKIQEFIKSAETKIDESGNEVVDVKYEKFPLLKYYRVFHIEDCEGIESKLKELELHDELRLIEDSEQVINNYIERESTLSFQNNKPSDRAFYAPLLDIVVVPMLNQYDSAEEYYSTAFHELIHSTMLSNRCNRMQEIPRMAARGEDYSREELVAEIGSAMLCNILGVSCQKAFNNSVAYIQSWIKVLKNDNKMIVWAASRAERAAKYILNTKEEV